MTASSHPVIAVDGTAASGKSTFSRELARRLGFAYVNTGAMYRGVTWYLQSRKIALEDSISVGQAIGSIEVKTGLREGELVFLVDGIDPMPHVRDGSVNQGVSLVAQVAEVRRVLVAQQQELKLQSPLVMEGRDIGTVVFPATPFKFFIDADAAVRAERRSLQGETDVIAKRDALDSQRQHSPLACAPDAHRLDSGRFTVNELVETALVHLSSRGLKISAG